MEKTLEQLAERIIHLDETALTELLPKYKKIMDDFQATEEWEKSVIIFFLINAVRVKNTLFNDNVLNRQTKKNKPTAKNILKLIKS